MFHLHYVFDYQFKSQPILLAIKSQGNNYVKKSKSDLSDIVSQDNPTHKDDDKMLSYAATELDVMSGLSFMVTWNVCMSTFTRGQSIRQATLRQLKIDYGHGPFCEDDVKLTRPTIISKLLLPQGTEKTANRIGERTYEQGMWPHKIFFRSPELMIAAILAYQLRRTSSVDFSFKAPDDDEHPYVGYWKLFSLVSWGKLTGQADIFQKVFKACDVSWRKTTHVRSAAIERATFYGQLAEADVAVVSNHGNRSSSFDRYETSFPKQVLAVCAGFKHGEQYFVPAEFAEIPCSVLDDSTECAKIVFGGEYDRWCSERNSDNGDKGTDAEHFLLEVIPFFAQKHFLYGYNWLKEFQGHDVSMDLRTMQIPGFASYASFADEMERKVNQVTADVLPRTASAGTNM